jgi:HSP20 family protein
MQARDLIPKDWLGNRNITPKKTTVSLFGEGVGVSAIDKILEDFKEEFNHFNDFLSRFHKVNSNSKMRTVPRIDFSETDDEFTIKVDLPGVEEAKLDILISASGVLTIKGEREEKEEQKNCNYYRLERSYGSFERSITLPDNYDSVISMLHFKDGILTLKCPKKELSDSSTKKIQITKK